MKEITIDELENVFEKFEKHYLSKSFNGVDFENNKSIELDGDYVYKSDLIRIAKDEHFICVGAIVDHVEENSTVHKIAGENCIELCDLKRAAKSLFNALIENHEIV